MPLLGNAQGTSHLLEPIIMAHLSTPYVAKLKGASWDADLCCSLMLMYPSTVHHEYYITCYTCPSSNSKVCTA